MERNYDLADILINEAIKILEDESFGHLPTTDAVAALLKAAAGRVDALRPDFMISRPELDQARERLGKFFDANGDATEVLF